jgi:hypothetical protein
MRGMREKTGAASRHASIRQQTTFLHFRFKYKKKRVQPTRPLRFSGIGLGCAPGAQGCRLAAGGTTWHRHFFPRPSPFSRPSFPGQLTEPQFTKVAGAKPLPHAEVWPDHQHGLAVLLPPLAGPVTAFGRSLAGPAVGRHLRRGRAAWRAPQTPRDGTSVHTGPTARVVEPKGRLVLPDSERKKSDERVMRKKRKTDGKFPTLPFFLLSPLKASREDGRRGCGGGRRRAGRATHPAPRRGGREPHCRRRGDAAGRRVPAIFFPTDGRVPLT